MCKYVAILVYQGLIENVAVFEDKGYAAGWLSRHVEEYGGDNCGDSIIWDTTAGAPINVGFAFQK